MRTKSEIIIALDRGFSSPPPRRINRNERIYSDGVDAGMKLALAWALGMSHEQAAEISAESWAAWKARIRDKSDEALTQIRGGAAAGKPDEAEVRG